MQVDNGVDAVFRTLLQVASQSLHTIKSTETYSINHTVQVLQSFLLEDAGVHVILEESVVDGETDTVQAQRCKAFCVLFREEVVQKLHTESLAMLKP